MASNTGRDLDRHFLGQGWAFPPSFDALGRGARMVSEVQDIEESLRILMATAPGERVMQPTYGCGLHRLVFEVVGEASLTEMRNLIERAVLFFEPRITLESVDFEFEPAEQGLLRIHLRYTVRSTNSRHNLVYPLYLLEGHGTRLDAWPGATA